MVPMDRADDMRRSKRLSLVLRHKPESIGIVLDHNGWVDVSELLDALGAHDLAMTRDQLDHVVQTNDKRRFEWDVVTDRIRARQGHSVKVDLGLEPSAPPHVLFHGTPRRNLDSIRATGLDKRDRHHVHLSPDEATAHRVGARRGDPVVLAIDAASMDAAGYEFWQSTNGVWLTYEVPPQFITTVGLRDGPDPTAVRDRRRPRS
jgi:putative RNA 2'-phosphotransferase